MLNMGYDVIFQGKNFLRLLGGLLVTAEIAFISVVIALILGTVFGVVMNSKSKVIRIISNIYLEAIRIIPILVWLFVGYFGISRLFNIHIDGVVVSIVVFSLWGIAEMGDLMRGAIKSIPKIQEESAMAIGLNKTQIYRYIIIPQALKRVTPSAINLSTRMIKTTSLVIMIGVVEVVKVGQQIIEVSAVKSPMATFWVYGFIFFLYFMICYPLSLLSKKLEKRWAY
ncbi:MULTISPECIES: amino acid ABC transporter permease [Clostridium]|uniref:amino acid ABC transporter permease n=1 Tax=Clostridium TaxID=1485 RepID=UPI002152765E|nr:amino acid ABC transporter permease [Clostridium sp. LY3-2]MCR6513871.1 amino acid ABC transporter permease [Clostridium sp. LY3-2]